MGFKINKLRFVWTILFVFPFLSRAQLIINEVSQGASGGKEYVELVVVGTPTCNAIPCVDIRGFYIDDNNGNHATGTGTGIASGCVRFTQDALWSCVPVGTLILIYNDADLNPDVPAQDLSLTDGNCTLVIPISNCTLFEKNISTPSTATATYPTTGFSACGNWTNISMANSDDSFQTIDASGNLVYSVSWGNNSTADIIYFAGNQGGMVCSMTNSTDNNPNTQSNWTSAVVAGNQTPGAPNNAANAAWINSMNNSCTALVPLTLTTSQTSAGCTCSGTASVTASGAIAPYTYSWAPSGGTAATASGLCPNTYTVTVTSSNGCVQTATVIVSADIPPTATTSVTPINCFGGTGSATVTASGGTSPYAYSWTPSGGTSATASSLATGIYTVTVTDAHSCTVTATANITQPTVLAATATATPANCFNTSTGSATVTATGGTSPYSYSWAPSGGTAATASLLIHGIYTVTVTDAHNCTVTATVNVTQPAVLAATTTVTPINCFGGTGSATVTASGGTSPYTYSWAPSGGTAATASSLTNGIYTVTVTDAHSCTITATANVTQPTVLAATTTVTPINCFGGSTGSATVTASGGTSPYTYSWTPSGGTSATASSLANGIYTVTVTDAHSCSVTATANITEPAALTATASATPANCFGGSTGSATVTASGGTSPYTYSWAPSGGTAATASSLANGIYTVTVTDAHSCTITATAGITQPTALTATTTASPVICFGEGSGSATVTASDGTSPYTYSWSPSGGTSATASSLANGIYTVTVTDAHSCTVTATANVTQPTALTATTAATPAACFGGSTGSATVTASGGISPYSYSWTPSGGTSATASSLANGIYTVTITDAHTCTITATANVTQPSQITSTVTSSPANCGASDGSASVAAAGGTGSYSYSWVPAGGASSNPSNLPSGNYSVTITDANLCAITSTVNIGSLSTLSVTASAAPVSCFGGSDGSASTIVTGGTGPFSYSWSPSGGTGATGTLLSNGTYSVTVSDANSCIASATVNITQPAQLTATTSVTAVTCFGGNDGSATVTAGGGTSPYSYLWSPSGGISSTASSLTNGMYSVTVTDANSCTVTTTANVVQPVQITATTTATPASCFGGTDGSANVTAGNGVIPYSYAWSPSGGNASTASSLANGIYTVTITDVNSCTITATANVTQPAVITGTTSSLPASCGMSNGSASVVASGGAGTYTYSWLPAGGSASSANNLATGNYSVTITDGNSCAVTETVIVNSAGSLSVTVTTNSVSCFGGSDGSVASSVTGGTPLSYSWAPGGQTTATINNVTAGNYTLSVTDANNCVTTVTTTVNEPAVISATSSVTPVSCFGGNNGSASLTVNGGTSSYTYSWAPSGGTSATASSLASRNYTVTVTDGNSCTFTTTVNVTEPAALTATVTASRVSCFGGNDGSAAVIAGGGTIPYTYLWSPSGGSSTTATALVSGIYSVTVTDANNCTVISACNVTQPTQLSAATNSSPSNCNHADGSASVLVSGGMTPYNYNWTGFSTVNNDTLNNIIPGNYTVGVTDANSCLISATVTVNNIPGIIISPGTVTPPLCFGASNGSADVSVSGGTLPYTFLWSDGQNSSSASNLSAGNYCVAASDAKGCRDSLCFVLTQPGAFSVASTGSVICSGQTASLQANTTGGISPYTFSWNGGTMTGTPVTVSPTGSNTYSVIATDANGCTADDTVIVAVFPPLLVVAATDDTMCAGSSAMLSATPSGGNGNYTLYWSPINQNGNNISVSPVANTTYTVTLTDGCTVAPAMDSLKIIVSPLPIVTFSADSLSGCQPLCTNFSDATTINTGSVSSWQWDFGDGTNSSLQNPHHCYTVPGLYSVSLQATSSAGCISSDIKNNYIDVYPLPSAEFTSDLTVTDILDASVNFTNQSAGATIYNWDFGDSTLTSSLQNPSHTYNTEGTFTVMLAISTSNGCKDTATHEIMVNSGFTFYAPNAFSPNKDTVNDIFLPMGVGWRNETFRLWIYDRWGNLCYDTNEVNKGWDGRANHGSDVAQEDVYIWKVDLTDIYDKKHHYLGKVTIVK